MYQVPGGWGGLGFQFFFKITCLGVIYHIQKDLWSLDAQNPPKNPGSNKVNAELMWMMIFFSSCSFFFWRTIRSSPPHFFVLLFLPFADFDKIYMKGDSCHLTPKLPTHKHFLMYNKVQLIPLQILHSNPVRIFKLISISSKPTRTETFPFSMEQY